VTSRNVPLLQPHEPRQLSTYAHLQLTVEAVLRCRTDEVLGDTGSDAVRSTLVATA
jgi:hypothetical protein